MLLLKRFLLTIVVFVALVLTLFFTIAFLVGGFQSNTAIGIGVVGGPLRLLLGLFLLFLLSAAISTWVIRG